MSKTKILFSGLFLAIFMAGNAYSGNITDVSALSITFEQNSANQYQLAKSTFLPETYDDLGLSGRHNTKYDYNQNDCSAYPLSSCPMGAKCSKCPFAKKYKINSCSSPYIPTSQGCDCPITVRLLYPNDKCILYCSSPVQMRSICIKKECTPNDPATGCTNGTQDCGDGCGKNTGKCCIACADTVTTKPANSSYTYSSCKDDDGTKNIQTGWACNSGYHKTSSNTCEKDCNITNCAGYTLTSCPANGNCSSCTKTAANCSTDGTMYRLDSCATGYSKSGDACVKAPSCETCSPGKILFSDGTCFSKNQTGKTVTGIVLSTNPNLVMSTYSGSTSYTGSGQSWITTSYISGLTNHSASSALNDMNGKNNTALIKNHGTQTGYYYLPIDYALSYSSGSIGKGSWFIPSGGQAKFFGVNKTLLNQGLAAVSGSQIGASDIYWTSSGTIYTGANPNTQNYFALDVSGINLLSYGSGHSNKTRYVAEFTPATCNSSNEENSSQDKLAIGDILYSDMTTSSEVISSKTPIGIVLDGSKRIAIALNETNGIAWSTTASFDIPNLSNKNDRTQAAKDMDGKSNTKIIVDYCKANKISCPAAEYAYNYTTAGTKAGDWYLGAFGEIKMLFERKYYLNSSLNKVSGTTVTDRHHYWSSTEGNMSGYGYAWNKSFYREYDSTYVDAERFIAKTTIKCTATSECKETVRPMIKF